MKKNILWTIGICILVIWTCNRCKTKTDSTSYESALTEVDSTVSLVDTALAAIEPPKQEWSYWDDEDKMTSKKTYYASIEANEKLEFDFPYNGGTTATLTIRKKPGETDVYIQFSKAQLLIDSYDGSDYRIRFDNNPPSTYTFLGASDHSSDIAFVQNTSRFIRNLKQHKKVIVEMQFYKEGSRAIEFNIAGFKWAH